jgi:hypothetical protein
MNVSSFRICEQLAEGIEDRYLAGLPSGSWGILWRHINNRKNHLHGLNAGQLGE